MTQRARLSCEADCENTYGACCCDTLDPADPQCVDFTTEADCLGGLTACGNNPNAQWFAGQTCDDVSASCPSGA